MMLSRAMKYGKIPGVEKPIPRVIQGLLGMSHGTLDEALELLDGVFEAGCFAFDVAPVYGRGNAERFLGEWSSRRGVRDSIAIITKGCHPSADGPRLNPAALAIDIERSLEQLRTDVIDLYLLHRDDPTVDVGEIVEALHQHVEAGRLRAVGASNWSCERIARANDYARKHGLVTFSASSPGFSLARAVRCWPGCIALSSPDDSESLLWYERTRLPVLAWSPLAGGFLAQSRSQRLDEAPGPSQRALEFYACESNQQRLERLRRMAHEKGVTVSQLALAYVLRQPFDAYLVVGPRTADEYRECSDALSIELSWEEVQTLEAG